MNAHDVIEERTIRSGFVGIVGPANAGKSTLLNALVGSKISIVSPKAQTTRNRVLGVRQGEHSQIAIVDTPGFVKASVKSELNQFLAHELSEAAAGVDVLVLLLDASREIHRPQAVTEILQVVKQHRLQRPAIIALNKVDLVEKERLLPLMQCCSELFAADDTVEILPLSARTGDGVEALVSLLEARLPEGPMLFPADMISDQSEQMLAAEIIREKVFLHLRDELPYATAVRVEQFEDLDQRIRIHATILVERDSQRGIVIGQKGSMLKKIGSSARIELERLFGTTIYLELFVKVVRDWSRTESGLRKAGITDY